MAEWWFDNGGQNMLSGVHSDDPDVPSDNPVRLPDDFIIDFLHRIPAARESFNRLYPQMSFEEKERLDLLLSNAVFLPRSPQEQTDRFQRSQNVVGVRTTGRAGGRRIGGNR